MKKKMLVCSLLVMFVLLTATTALAYNVKTYTRAYAGSAGFTSSMRGVNTCTKTTVGGSPIGHRCWLADSSGTRRSIIQEVSSNVPETIYLYPTATGTLRLRLENYYYYNQYELHAVGTFTSSY